MIKTYRTLGYTVFFYMPYLVSCAIIFVLSSLRGDQVEHLLLFEHSDKVFHLLAFSIVGATAALGGLLRLKTANSMLCLEAAFLSIGYALFDEFHQLLVPGRTFSILDFAADTAGVLLGIYLLFKVVNRLQAKFPSDVSA